MLPLPRRDGEPLQRWLYRSIRQQIVAGQLRSGSVLPSSRAIAASLGIARGTVVLAFEQLVAEGYVHARPGAGTRVATLVPDAVLTLPAVPALAHPTKGRWRALTSPFVEGERDTVPLPFTPHRCETRQLPVEVLRRLHQRVLRSSNPWLFRDGPAAGLPALRSAIAAYLAQARGLAVDPGQVIVLGSTQQALDLVTRVVTRPGDAVWLEDPGYQGARRLLEQSGRELVHVRVDADGLRVGDGIARAPRAALAFVTPSRQSPLGIPLSPARRAQLLAWADSSGAIVFEDDYDSEYRFNARPVPPLAASDVSGSVVLAGSFSKILYPGLRLAYLVSPPALVDPLRAMAGLMARHPNVLAQAVLAAFIQDGHLARHVRRMRRLYMERAEAFAHAARTHWAGRLEVPALQAGLDATVRLLGYRSDVEAAQRLRRAGVQSIPLSAYCSQARLPPALVLGFAAVDAGDLPRCVLAAAKALA